GPGGADDGGGPQAAVLGGRPGAPRGEGPALRGEPGPGEARGPGAQTSRQPRPSRLPDRVLGEGQDQRRRGAGDDSTPDPDAVPPGARAVGGSAAMTGDGRGVPSRWRRRGWFLLLVPLLACGPNPAPPPPPAGSLREGEPRAQPGIPSQPPPRQLTPSQP